MNAATSIARTDFGKTRDGIAVSLYTLLNKNALEARITNYGGIVVSLKAPDRAGKMAEIVLGFDSLDGYLANPGPFFGALVGRYANSVRNTTDFASLAGTAVSNVNPWNLVCMWNSPP